MRHPYILGSLIVVALYLVVPGGPSTTVESVDNPVFPQVCRVVMPEDLGR